MSLLRDLYLNNPSSVKIGFFGDSGSGKTLTAGLLALGLSKHLHNNAPVCIADAEQAARFLTPIYHAEDVRLFVVPSHSFIDMRDGLAEATAQNCCAYIVDNYTASHKELAESAKAAWNLDGRRMPYALREELDRIWGEWVRLFRGSTLHVLLNGRLGYTWDEAEDEAGDPRFVKLGTKMRGERDMGYEPDLLVELEAIRTSLVRDKRTKTKTGHMRHAAVILKDRWRTLNGKTFLWKDVNEYVQGQFETVYRDFAPHIIAQTSGSDTLMVCGESVARSSAALFTPATGESKFAEAQRRRQIALEKIDSALAMIWPGQTGDEKRLRHIVLQSVFKTRSRTEIEGKDPLTLESAVQLVEAFESILPSEKSRDEAEVIATIESARNDLREKSEAF